MFSQLKKCNYLPWKLIFEIEIITKVFLIYVLLHIRCNNTIIINQYMWLSIHYLK